MGTIYVKKLLCKKKLFITFSEKTTKIKIKIISNSVLIFYDLAIIFGLNIHVNIASNYYGLSLLADMQPFNLI